MRCVGASSAPCVRLELPAPGLSSRRVTNALMACCRARKSGCAAMPGCPMRRMPGSTTASYKPMLSRSAVSAPPCLVSIRELVPAPGAPAHRSPWLLHFSPALAPPTALVLLFASRITPMRRWTYTAAASPHAAPNLNGLRAPPA